MGTQLHSCGRTLSRGRSMLRQRVLMCGGSQLPRSAHRRDANNKTFGGRSRTNVQRGHEHGCRSVEKGPCSQGKADERCVWENYDHVRGTRAGHYFHQERAHQRKGWETPDARRCGQIVRKTFTIRTQVRVSRAIFVGDTIASIGEEVEVGAAFHTWAHNASRNNVGNEQRSAESAATRDNESSMDIKPRGHHSAESTQSCASATSNNLLTTWRVPAVPMLSPPAMATAGSESHMRRTCAPCANGAASRARQRPYNSLAVEEAPIRSAGSASATTCVTS